MAAKYVEACELGDWHLELYPDGKGGRVLRTVFRCRSWRHAGECRLWKGAQDFVRVAEALEGEQQWAFLVLTFSQREWTSPWEQYRCGGRCWSALHKRMQRAYGYVKYVQTWERFRKGGCHVNVVIWCPAIIDAVSSDWRAWRKDWLTPNCVDCGFGPRCWVELLRTGGRAMAGYLTKLSRELTGGGKDYQIPVDAPPHFRRLRASRHTLPPPYKSGVEGRLVMLPLPKEKA